MIPLTIGKEYRIINTEKGLGLPGYTDAHAPFGGQYSGGKIPEGEVVLLLGLPNPNKYVEILYEGLSIWVDGEGHLEAINSTTPTTGPTDKQIADAVRLLIDLFKN